MLERQRRRVHEAVTPHLEPGESIEAVFIGQTPIPPIVYNSGSMFAQVDDGPKLWVMPFGPVKKALDELTDAVRRRQAVALPGETGG